MSDYILKGKVVLNRDGIPCVELEGGNLMPPTMVLYQKYSSKPINGAEDGDFRVFQSGYMRRERGYGLRDALRAIFDPVFAHGMNRFMKFYEAGLDARKDLEKRVGEVIEL